MVQVQGADDYLRAGLSDDLADAMQAALEAAAAAGARALAVDGPPTTADLAVVADHFRRAVDGPLAAMLADCWEAGAAAIRLSIADADLEPVAALTAAGWVPPPPAPQLATDYLAGATNRLAGVSDATWAATRQALTEGMAAGESAPQLAARVRQAAEVPMARALQIARNEALAATAAGEAAQVTAAGMGGTKTWHSMHDLRVRPTHVEADGQTSPLHLPFLVGGWRMQRPHDPAGPAEETVNCRCTLSYDLVPPPPPLAGQDTDLPPWKPVMTPAEADRFTASSAVRQRLYVRSPTPGKVRAQGFRLDPAADPGPRPAGHYLTRQPQYAPGEGDVLEVAANVAHPVEEGTRDHAISEALKALLLEVESQGTVSANFLAQPIGPEGEPIGDLLPADWQALSLAYLPLRESYGPYWTAWAQRAFLQAEGYDGVVVYDAHGQVVSLVVFTDQDLVVVEPEEGPTTAAAGTPGQLVAARERDRRLLERLREPTRPRRLLARLLLGEAFMAPHQPRDRRGRWTDAGGVGPGADGGTEGPGGAGAGGAGGGAVPSVTTDNAKALGWRDFEHEPYSTQGKEGLLAWNDWMADEGHLAIQNYLETGTAKGWLGRRDAAGGRTWRTPQDVKRDAGLIRGMMRPSTADAVGYRGIALRQQLRPGDRFRGKGFVAVAPSRSEAREFAYGRAGLPSSLTDVMAQVTPGTHPYVLQMILPKGTPGVRNKQFESVVDGGTYRVLSASSPGPGGLGEVTVIRE